MSKIEEHHLWKFNYYLGLVGMQRSIEELRKNISTMKPAEFCILEGIISGNVNYVKSLHDSGLYIGNYKSMQYALAVKFGHFNMIDYLYQNRFYNMNYAGFEGLMNIIAVHGSAETFNYVLEKYRTLFEKNLKIKALNVFEKNLNIKELTVKAFYESKQCANFTPIFYKALINNNLDVVMAMWKNKHIREKINILWCKDKAKEDEKYGWVNTHLVYSWFEISK